MPTLNGKTIAFVEARMTSELAGLIRRHGGVPYPAPALQEIYRQDDPAAQQLIRDIIAGQVDAVALLTGVGANALVQTAAAMGQEAAFLEALNRLIVIARSPKPARVLRRHQIHIDLMPPEPFTTADLLNALAQSALALAGKTVAVQHYGGPNRPLVQGLRERGAQVREVVLYTWGLPADETPVVALIDAMTQGDIAALAFTSQPQVGNLLDIAARAGREGALRQAIGHPDQSGPAADSAAAIPGPGEVVVASIGPVCTRRLAAAGLRVDVEPEHPHMGNMVLALADYWAAADSGGNPAAPA